MSILRQLRLSKPKNQETVLRFGVLACICVLGTWQTLTCAVGCVCAHAHELVPDILFAYFF